MRFLGTSCLQDACLGRCQVCVPSWLQFSWFRVLGEFIYPLFCPANRDRRLWAIPQCKACVLRCQWDQFCGIADPSERGEGGTVTVSMARSGDLPGWITLVGLVTKPSALPIPTPPKIWLAELPSWEQSQACPWLYLPWGRRAGWGQALFPLFLEPLQS